MTCYAVTARDGGHCCLSPRNPRREPKHYQPPGLDALAGNHEAGCGRSRPKNRAPGTHRPELEAGEVASRGVGDCNPEPAANDAEERPKQQLQEPSCSTA